MKVIQDAFHEGRETDVSWEDSKAREDEIRLDAFVSNVENFDGRVFKQVIPLEQVCPATGKVLRTFGSRLDAARWIVANVLKVDDPKGAKAQSITGNMQMCMALGYKSYGFYWKTINEAKHKAKLLDTAKQLGSKALFVLDNRTAVVKPATFPSIAAAAKCFGISERQIRRCMADGTPAYKGVVFREYNPVVKKKHFDDVESAAEFFGVKPTYIHSVLVKGSTINNIKFTLTEKKQEIINVYLGRKIIASFPDAAKAARHFNVARTTITRSIESRRLLLGMYRCERAVAK